MLQNISLKAYAVKVIMTDKLNFNTFVLYEKNELFVTKAGRLGRFEALIETKELAEQFKDELTKRRIKSGDKGFEAEVIQVSSSGEKFQNQITADTIAVKEKLNSWKK